MAENVLIKCTNTLKNRAKSRVRGVIFFALGVLVLIDSPYPFPIPFTGLPSVILATLITIYGVYNLYNGLRLPVKEVLYYLSSRDNNEATVAEVLEFLGPEVTDSEQLIRVLEKKNLALRATRNLEYVESHEEVPENLLILTESGQKSLK
jgi:hypothetical protein